MAPIARKGEEIRPIPPGNRSRHRSEGKLVLRLARADDRKVIYRMRNDIYAAELRQHEEQPHKSLSDPLDASNVYILATAGDEIVGFISITPPGGRYSSFHGGAFWDAWFPPSPKVLDLLRRELPWLVQTSPPTGCEGLLETITRVRGVQTANLLPGAGSSDLMFLALRHWLTPHSRALILDPTYGEYAHILERVIGCRVDRLTLDRRSSFQLSLPRLLGRIDRGYDLVVLVNPNSPTGQLIPGRALQEVLRCAPRTTRIWIDETYIDYAGVIESLERFATTTSNLVVCKSMSKAYALSGLRVAYLCGAASVIDDLRALTPP